MIRPGEVQQKANAAGVRDQQIEKDYILSWILFGFEQTPTLMLSIGRDPCRKNAFCHATNAGKRSV